MINGNIIDVKQFNKKYIAISQTINNATKEVYLNVYEVETQKEKTLTFDMYYFYKYICGENI